ncbi:hypothetical protein KKA03_05840, partial [archaeon]|nr:hypothetical protein [archaeon]
MKREFPIFLVGVFFLTFATLTYEVALSYEFAYMFWFEASVAILSTAMFGLGIGGVLGYFLQGRYPGNYYRLIRLSIFTFGMTLFLSLYFIASGSRAELVELSPAASSMLFRLGFNPAEIVPLLYFSLAAALPFVFSGIALSLALNYPGREKRAISYIYFADLFGA